MNEMNEWLNSIGPAAANHLWQSTAFVAAVWAITLALRKNQARVRYALWLTASVKFLLPFSLLVSVGGMLPQPRRSVAPPAVYATVDEVAQPFSQMEYAPLAPPIPTFSQRIEARLPITLAALWLCGMAIVLVIWTLSWRQVWLTLRRAQRVESGREFDLLRQAEIAAGRRALINLRLSRELMEPGIFGLFHPLLIWPEQLSSRLDDRHIDAILIHELAHAQRRDNLAAALHMLVEAVFWFHPAVWWMERCMVEERERACDEAVVALGARPSTYAESLLKTARFCVESPLTCVAGITGANLKDRVRSIMTLRLESMSNAAKLALTLLGLLVVAAPVAFGVMRMSPIYGQLLHAIGPRPSFAVASIRPSQPGDMQSGSEQADSYIAKAKTLQDIIKFAYGIGYDRELSGGPGWLSTDKYTILAKPDDAEVEALKKMSRDDRDQQLRLMVQALLADRFGLKVSFVKEVLPVYALIVAKGGLKCAKDEDAKPAIPNMSQPRFRWSEGPAPPPPPPGWTPPTPEESRKQAQTTAFHMRTQGWPFWLVVTTLSHYAELGGRTVVDETGLHGSYDCQMYWSPDGSNGPGPSLFTAIEQQMGLKLEPTKAPVEILVVDQIQKPKSVDGAESTMTAVPQPSPIAGDISQSVPKMMPVARAQQKAVTQIPNPSFSVSTVKPANASTNETSGIYTGHGRLDGQNVTLKRCIIGAYGVGPHQVIGGPAWLDTARFDIQAKADQDINDDSTLNAMQAALIADRFKLVMHKETRMMPAYVLELDRGAGPKMEAAPGGDSGTEIQIKKAANNSVKEALEVKNTGMDLFAAVLARQMDLPVVNETGLKGIYNFDLNWTQDDAGAAGDADAVSIFTAIGEQLGLRLRAAKAPVELLVIDHAEMPAGN